MAHFVNRHKHPIQPTTVYIHSSYNKTEIKKSITNVKAVGSKRSSFRPTNHPLRDQLVEVLEPDGLIMQHDSHPEWSNVVEVGHLEILAHVGRYFLNKWLQLILTRDEYDRFCLQ